MTVPPNWAEIREAIAAAEAKSGEPMSPSSKEWFIKAMSTEELLPELQPFVVPDGPMGPMLKHPLVFEVVGIRPGIANDAFRRKSLHLVEALEQGRWHTYVFLHERPYRVDALLDLDDMRDELGDRFRLRDFISLIASVWTDSENIWQNREEWEQLFSYLEDSKLIRSFLMNPADEGHWDQLPDPVVPVYRGCIRDFNEDGLSWTLDRNVARFFAKRYVDAHDNLIEATVLVGEVDKGEVVAYFDESHRGEKEIVVRTDTSVRVLRAEEP